MKRRRALWLSLDVRPDEWQVGLLAFGVLALILAGHTVLETARDALLLTKVPARGIGLVYVALAGCTLPVAAAAGRASERFGPRQTLVGTLITACAASLTLLLLPTNRASVMVLYIASGLIGSIAVTQFWSLLGTVLTVTQGRRLIGPIASAGVIGGVLGSGAAALAIPAIPVKALLPFAGAIFLAASGLLLFVPASSRPLASPPALTKSIGALREEPFLIRVALVVAFSTMTLLAIDYFFKWTVLRTVPKAHVAVFVARYYALLNVASLLVQLLLASAIVRRLGVATSMSVSPVLLSLCAASAFVLGGSIPAVMLLKGSDDSLRNSVHRTTIELLYLPVRSDLRQRAKLLIDGALARVAQAAAAATLLGLTESRLLSPRAFAGVVVGLAAAWLASAVWARDSYLGLVRRAMGSPQAADGPDPLDLAGAELLVEHLASDSPMQVVAAMSALERRGRQRLIPALVLHHDDERVLVWALEAFGASSRQDWISLGRRLLEHASETVRVAAMRALARAETLPLDLERLIGDAGPRVQGYAMLRQTLAEPAGGDVLDDPRIAALIEGGPSSEAARLGVLAGIADSPASPRLSSLLLALDAAGAPGAAAEWTPLLARAASRQGDPRMIPRLVSRLGTRAGREAVQTALVDLGGAALEALWAALCDPERERPLRAHLPLAIGRFGNQRAAELLLESIEMEQNGLVRYKSIRALGRLVADRRVRIDRARVQRLSQSNLVEHFRLLALRVQFAPRARSADESLYRQDLAEQLLANLLEDKLRQALERAFRLLKIAYPAEDIHRAHVASASADARSRANAGEFLDALLTGRRLQPLRELFRLVSDDLTPLERARRAAEYLSTSAPTDRDAALMALIDDPDLVVSALAAFYARAFGTEALVAAAERARRLRPAMARAGARLFDGARGLVEEARP